LYKILTLIVTLLSIYGCSGGSSLDEDNSYKIHKDITSTIFWVGEESSSENGGIANLASAWDEEWKENFGGVDTPDERDGYLPKGFIPKENPFYIALPFNDFDDEGDKKEGLLSFIPWAKKSDTQTQSLCKNRWVKIEKDGKVAYGQWEDVGPFGEEDRGYVFGDGDVKNSINNHAGIDLSPALKTYLDLEDIDSVTWSFVDDKDVPEGPWRERVTIKNVGWTQEWYRPTKESSWQWQLTGELNSEYDVDMYDIDLFDTSKEVIDTLHNEGRKVICYFSAGSYEDWREDKDSFNASLLGNELDGWEGERWLDISNPLLHPIMLKRLDIAKERGCDGVEPDNIDGHTNDTGFELDEDDQFYYNKFLADEAHQRGLSIALKNDKSQILELEPYFDFAISEECYDHESCDKLTTFIEANKPALNAEYEVDDESRDTLCNYTNALGIKTLLLPLNLDGSFRDSCE